MESWEEGNDETQMFGSCHKDCQHCTDFDVCYPNKDTACPNNNGQPCTPDEDGYCVDCGRGVTV